MQGVVAKVKEEYEEDGEPYRRALQLEAAAALTILAALNCFPPHVSARSTRGTRVGFPRQAVPDKAQRLRGPEPSQYPKVGPCRPLLAGVALAVG